MGATRRGCTMRTKRYYVQIYVPYTDYSDYPEGMKRCRLERAYQISFSESLRQSVAPSVENSCVYFRYTKEA